MIIFSGYFNYIFTTSLHKNKCYLCFKNTMIKQSLRIHMSPMKYVRYIKSISISWSNQKSKYWKYIRINFYIYIFIYISGILSRLMCGNGACLEIDTGCSFGLVWCPCFHEWIGWTAIGSVSPQILGFPIGQDGLFPSIVPSNMTRRDGSANMPDNKICKERNFTVQWTWNIINLFYQPVNLKIEVNLTKQLVNFIGLLENLGWAD